jgi:hypothetical protein
MRYLVIAQSTGALPNVPPQQLAQMLDTVVVPSLEMLAKWEREGRMHGGSFVGRRGGCLTITPLTSDEAAAKRFRELSQRMKSAGQR